MILEWHDKTFAELTTDELFAINLLRANVFNGEQKCITPDPDLMDKQAHHVFAIQDGKLAAYGRYYLENGHASLGRVAVNPLFRRQGFGRQLVQHLMDGIAANFPGKDILIHAQFYIKGLYEQFGFTVSGDDVFFEAEREHITMTHPAL